ncbi:basic proline-rich protein-like [Felis catus]|uniref:basic proline-rich protein-like n=1 Tax=Felis catus TaxID=9685 RepID=UPI001D1A1561|nr:basic proline-rich protein-like [Felis catus]
MRTGKSQGPLNPEETWKLGPESQTPKEPEPGLWKARPSQPGSKSGSPREEGAGGWGTPPPHPPTAAHKLGAPPGRLPARPPPPPHLRRAAPCSAPGRPQRSTGAPPGSSPRAATRSRPARPRLRGAPSPAGPRPARVGGAARGRGRRGVPAPGADTRRHPASREADQALAGAAPGDPGSPSPRAPAPRAGRLRTRPRPRVTLYYPYPGPGASSSWSLFEHKGPGAKAAALPPPLLRSKPPPLDTLSGFGVQSETPRVGCPSPAPTPATGTLRPRMSRGPRLAPGLPPTPSGWWRNIWTCGGGATWRRIRDEGTTNMLG